MDIKLVVVGRKVKENTIAIEPEVTKYMLKINNVMIEDITQEILSNFNVVFSPNIKSKANFELRTGEKFENINMEFEYL